MGDGGPNIKTGMEKRDIGSEPALASTSTAAAEDNQGIQAGKVTEERSGMDRLAEGVRAAVAPSGREQQGDVRTSAARRLGAATLGMRRERLLALREDSTDQRIA